MAEARMIAAPPALSLKSTKSDADGKRRIRPP